MSNSLNPQVAKKFEVIKASPEMTEAITELKEQKFKHEILPGIAPIWHVDLQKMDIKEPSYLVDRLIGEGCINLISGLPDSHKSFIANEILRCVSLGIPFLDVFPTKRTKGLIIDEENSLGRSKLRLSLLSEEPLDIAILAEQHIKIDEKGVAEALIKFCKANDVGVIVFDSLSSFHSAEENSNTAMAAVHERFMLIKQAGITVIIIVHEAKSSNGDPRKATPRGAGDTWGKCDVQLSLRHIGGDNNRISVNQLKNRDGDRLEFTIDVHKEDNRTWFEYLGQIPQQVGKDQQTDDAIFEVLLADGELNQKQVIEALKPIDGIGGQKKIAERLNALVGIKFNLRKGDHNESLYSIKPEAQDG